MKKLKFLFTMLVLMVTASASAEGMQYVVFDLKDGTQTVIALEDKPVITCQGGHITCTVNGVLVNEAIATATEGYIGFQSEGGALEFRDIWVE
jgi:hypothetical protein